MFYNVMSKINLTFFMKNNTIYSFIVRNILITVYNEIMNSSPLILILETKVLKSTASPVLLLCQIAFVITF